MELRSGKHFTPYSIDDNEAYMNHAQLKHFKAILTAWKLAITGHNDKTLAYLQSDTSQLADANDRASQEEEFSLTLRSRDRERKLIYKIDTALDRITNNHFGYCQECDTEIGIRRLEARPTAELCIDCKEIEERREHLR